MFSHAHVSNPKNSNKQICRIPSHSNIFWTAIREAVVQCLRTCHNILTFIATWVTWRVSFLAIAHTNGLSQIVGHRLQEPNTCLWHLQILIWLSWKVVNMLHFSRKHLRFANLQIVSLPAGPAFVGAYVGASPKNEIHMQNTSGTNISVFFRCQHGVTSPGRAGEASATSRKWWRNMRPWNPHLCPGCWCMYAASSEPLGLGVEIGMSPCFNDFLEVCETPNNQK